ncbi:MAG TPA: hypothetical protein PKC49_06050 [Phycisphaerae bacterium]|nr:hypothetical protein [Phycisphaerae bacterium]
MSRLFAALIVLAIAGSAAVTSKVLASTIANMECRTGECSVLSQTCIGTGACTFCTTGGTVSICVVALNKTCNGVSSIDCGPRYSGYCVHGICTGSNYDMYNCPQITCNPTPP